MVATERSVFVAHPAKLIVSSIPIPIGGFPRKASEAAGCSRADAGLDRRFPGELGRPTGIGKRPLRRTELAGPRSFPSALASSPEFGRPPASPGRGRVCGTLPLPHDFFGRRVCGKSRDRRCCSSLCVRLCVRFETKGAKCFDCHLYLGRRDYLCQYTTWGACNGMVRSSFACV